MRGKRKHRTTAEQKAAHAAKGGSGYCRPPKSGQIKPGEVRNPAGARRKAKPSFWEDFQAEMQQIVTITVGERSIKITKQQALMKLLLDESLARRSLAAAKVALGLAQVSERRTSDQPEPSEVTPEEKELLREFIRRGPDLLRSAEEDV